METGKTDMVGGDSTVGRGSAGKEVSTTQQLGRGSKKLLMFSRHSVSAACRFGM